VKLIAERLRGSVGLYESKNNIAEHLHSNEAQYRIALCKRKVGFMKTKLLTVVCVTVIGLCSVNAGQASRNEVCSADVVSDVVLIRPVYFVGTVLGSVFFVAALPMAAVTGSVKQTADVLVVQPGKMTFIRPVGDFSRQ
jgi:hypothetical protein